MRVAAATKAVTTLEILLRSSQKVLLVCLLSPAWVGRSLGIRDGTGNNNIRRECGHISTWHVMLEVQAKANASLLALVGVIKNHLSGNSLRIVGSAHLVMEVGVVSCDVLIDLCVQANQVRRTQILTIIIHTSGMQVTSYIPKVCVIRMHSHTNIVSGSITFILQHILQGYRWIVAVVRAQVLEIILVDNIVYTAL